LENEYKFFELLLIIITFYLVDVFYLPERKNKVKLQQAKIVQNSIYHLGFENVNIFI
jgi:hypothetical protein